MNNPETKVNHPGMEGNQPGEAIPLEHYRESLDEFSELKQLEEQYQRTSENLAQTRGQLHSLENELRLAREEEEQRKARVDVLFKDARARENEGLLEDALQIYLEILELQPGHARSLHAVEKLKKDITEKEEARRQEETSRLKKLREAEERFESGKRFYREGHYDQALKDFNEALLLGGQNEAILDFKNRCEARCREIEDALTRAKEESEAKQRQIHELMVQANSLLRQEKPEDAIVLYEKALLIEPDHKEAREGLHQAEIRLQEKRSILEKEQKDRAATLAQIREYQLSGMEHYRSGRLLEAIEAWESVLALDPARDDVLEDIRRAQQLLEEQKQRHAEEIEKIRAQKEAEALRQEQEREAELQRAELQHKRLLEEQSRAHENREKTIKEKYAEGVHLVTLGEYVPAMEAFAVVMAEDPDFEEVQRYVQVIRDQIIEQQIRQREKEAASQKHRENQKKEYMDQALKYLTKEDWASALPYLERLAAMDPEDVFVHKELEHARASLLKGREESLRRQKAVEEQEARRRRATELHGLARRSFAEKRYEKAFELWSSALEQDPENEDVAQGLKLCEQVRQEAEKQETDALAARQAEESELAKQHFQALEMLRDLRFDEAVDTWRRVLDLDPEHKDAQKGILVAKSRLRDQVLCGHLQDEARQMLQELQRDIKEMNEAARLASQLTHQGHFDKAIQLWNQILSQKK